MTDETKLIKGSGGGPPAPPPPPYRAPDTLHSRSFATIQDLISEGEIEGFASASKEGLTKGTTAYNNASLKDVFLDDTPILQSSATSASPADSEFNFQDVTFKSKFGTSNQTAMSGIPAESRSPTGVAVTVTTSAPVTRQITNTDVDAVIVTLTWPQIQVAEDDGDIRGDTVEYKIEIQYQSGGFAVPSGFPTSLSVSGRTADAYARDHRVTLDRDRILAGTAFPVDIRVSRITADSTESNRVNAFQFTSFQEVIDNDSTYADSAYVALRLDSKQFNRIPTRKYRIRGVKVRIPGAGASSSGTPTVDIQTGRIDYPDGYIFNGVMGAAVYTNCPAMCLLDLLTNTRYGLGDHVTDSNLDLFSFVAASKYANTEVDDGTGSGAKEARFSCNVNIQSPKEAFAAINDLAGVMRCMPIWSAGSITISQDKETTASYLFNLANVGETGFTYQGSSLKQRHSVVSVSYFNMDSKEVDFELIEDATAISKLGTIVKQVKAFACTSRNQAARLGRAILFAEQNESETCSFTTSIDAGIIVRPGSVIEINDPVRAGARRGGRVVAATTTTITIDALEQTGLPVLNDNPTISVILSDGSVETGVISDMTGAVITVNSVTKPDGTTASAFTSAPNVNAPYLISSTTLQTQLFRVIQVEEQDDINYVVTALSYVEGKYAFIENGTALPTRTISVLNAPALPPSNLTVTEQTVVINSIARSKLIVDWQPLVGVTQYLVNYKLENGNFVSQIVFSSDFELLDTVKGTYTIQVFSYNARGEISANSTTTTFVAQGKTALPENVSGLTIEPINEQFVRLRFTQATAIDVLHGGRVYVRHTNQTGGAATFQSAQDVIQAVAGNATEVIAPALAGTYLLKFQDDGGRFSATAASVALSVVDILDSITVKTDREDTDGTPYNGTKSNVMYDSSLGGLKLIDPTANATGTYDFVDTLDLGATFSLVLKRHFQGVGFYTGDQFDNRTDNIDTWQDFDGSIANEVNAKIAVKTSTDMSSYTDFNDFANGTFKGRGFQFRITLDTTDTAQNMNLQQAGYTATMPSRTEQSSVIASGAGAKAVTFTAPFFVGTSGLGNLNSFLPSVNISPQNMATGDYFVLSSISGTGFTVHFKNSSNASIDRNFTYSAVGFGKGG
nr:phage-related protein tail component-like protein [uncultured Mediterranean phage uvMED]BAR21615.1 phage-related protein tail component-like protein [uncultured Mediterranean phage uvMED]BAR21685.1 phage-related protein tail component-like protein [uncultured Mediterranean phage uvMED]BAR21696.1 phage-related protein tail component-like protein [uncultured Mediterranean phage uvMED]BAR21717.1 phage-related protein tail component-like protein [uncultured Mediterranean phage uvMED]